MKLVLTAEEAVDDGIWDAVCKVTGFDHYALHNGMSPDTEIALTMEQAKEIGFEIFLTH